MTKSSFLSCVVIPVLMVSLISCSNTEDDNYYYYDPAAAGPQDPNAPGSPENMSEQDVSSGNASDNASYTQRRPVSSEPKPWQSQSQEAQPTVRYPTGTKVSGKPGLVKSPYAPYAGDVDVKGIPSGTQVKCPYTGKIFIVP